MSKNTTGNSAKFNDTYKNVSYRIHTTPIHYIYQAYLFCSLASRAISFYVLGVGGLGDDFILNTIVVVHTVSFLHTCCVGFHYGFACTEFWIESAR